MGQAIVEVFVFKLREGVSEEQFVQVAAQSAEYVAGLSGLIDRELLGPAEDGTWVDIVHWESMEAATKAVEAVMSSPDCQPFLSATDEGQTQMLHPGTVDLAKTAPA
ncbi:MAG TPA: hypothetical protein QGF05_13165 [Dehalococcoidia bacterium]|nr:hypothetical protein [Dehalococcoidia bacterium]